MNLKQKAAELKKKIPAIYLALSHKDLPFSARLMALITVGYALSPIDLIPDFIPVFGYLDDLLILPLLAALTCRLIPKEIWDEALLKAENLWENGKPKKWYYGLPVLFIWLLILIWIYKAIIH